MIHNPLVNNDLVSRGVRFIFSPDGAQLLSFSELCDNDVVIIPAFGSSREVVADIESSGAKIYWYDATCPFVLKIHKIARESDLEIDKTALRVVGHAVASGHMREHAMIACDYAVKTVGLMTSNNFEKITLERKWQLNEIKKYL